MKVINNFLRYFPQFLAATPALLTVLSFATHLGWTSPALPEYIENSNIHIKLNNEQASWFASIISIGCIIGLLFTILIGDRCSRKQWIVITSLPLLLAWLVIIFAENIEMLYTARLLAGFGWGMSATIVPIYTGEIATDNLRGALSSSFQIMLACGPIIEYGLVPLTGAIQSAIYSMLIPIIILILVYWMPESPYYSIIKNNEQQAIETLKKLRGSKTNITNELEEIKKTVAYQTLHKGTILELISHKNHRRGLFIMFGIYTTQAFCGTVVILFYAHTIFKDINVEISENILAFILITIPCVSSILSTIFVDIVGKKPFLIISTFGCFLTMLVVAVYFHLRDIGYDVVNYNLIPAIALILFKFIHGLGIAGIPFIQLSELFASNIKILAVSLCKGYLFILHFIANRLYQIISDNFGYYIPFYIFSLVSILGMIFIICFVPETKGDSLHEIQLKLGAKYDEAKLENNLSKKLSFDIKLFEMQQSRRDSFKYLENVK